MLSRLVTILMFAGVMVVAGVSPAAAEECQSNAPWTSESAMTNYQGRPDKGCIRTFVTEPGVGKLLKPNSTATVDGLLSPTRMQYYRARGISNNFLWYAPRRTITTGSEDSRTWSGCKVDVPVGGVCPASQLQVTAMGSVFANPVSLHVIGDESDFIVLACGNFSTPHSPPPTVPTIEGVKFRDNDRDGVRDAGERLLAGWTIKISRESSRVGQDTGPIATLQSDSQGRYSFPLSGHGPGRYVVEEVSRDGWKQYAPSSGRHVVDVGFGVGSRTYKRDFGNAETVADVAKTSMSIVDQVDHLDVDTPTDVTVSVTIESFGPAAQVPVRDELVAVLPEDCSTPLERRSFTATLRPGEPVTREFTFSVTCRQPSMHHFQVRDVLAITHPDIDDTKPSNNEASVSFTAPVHAYTDLSTAASLTCDERTDVDVAAACNVGVTVTNDGFGSADVPIDATAAVELDVPGDCTTEPERVLIPVAGLVDGDEWSSSTPFSVTCSHRSFHEIEASVAVTPDDPHVFDVDLSNNTAGHGPSIMEVFHDATMGVTDAHLVCEESVGDTTVACTADLEFAQTGPAPAVEAVLHAELTGQPDCTARPASRQEELVVLNEGAPQSHSFTWTLDCPVSETLRPFTVTADVQPSASEPHAVDEPNPVSDDWIVPYCLPTVNPHGEREPQAPGQGMNEDGFYIFGTLPDALGAEVRIRDDGSGVEFGPFSNGTRIKWVEANGAEPRIFDMGGNNGNGRGQARAVDYRIRAQGDAQAFYVDEKSVEVSVTCLVPPFPQ